MAWILDYNQSWVVSTYLYRICVRQGADKSDRFQTALSLAIKKDHVFLK